MDYNSTYNNFNQPNFPQIILFMKQKLFGAASLVAFILFGASCSNQEQSEFNLDSVKQQVTISATVTYSTGVDVNATSYSIVNSKPAAGRRVFIEVPYAQYSAAAAAGNKIFETVTDENGKFSITIPTKSTGITGTIRMEEFTDVYRTYEKMDADGKPVFKSELRNYDFTYNFAANALKPGGLQFPEELVYNSKKIDVDQFSNNVTMTGKVNLAYETGFRKGAFKAASKATVEFTVVYDYGTTSELELKFGTTTDAQGNYSISLPVKSLADGFHITGLKVLGIGDSQFTHYDTDSTTVKVYGAYELMNFGNTAGVGGLNFANIIEGVTYNLGSQNLLFTPYYNAGVTDAANAKPDNWDDNLIGWAAGMTGFDESYSKTATLTGKVYMPYLVSFGEAAYRNEPQTIVLTGPAPYDNGLTVITDAQGNFSVDIPVQDDNAIAFTVELAEDVQPFEFIDSKSKKIVLREGAYDNNTQIKAEGAQWYELGDFYFHYTPDGVEQPTEWNNDLIGWYKSAEFNVPVQVRGNILFAVETSYGIGEYVAQTRIVEVYDATNDRTFAIKTKANGAYDFMIPLKDENDQPNISITSATYATNEFVHYPKYNEDATKLISGTYSIYKTVYGSKDDNEAWNNLGTQYMYIATGDLDHAVSTYNDDLAGWYVLADGNDVVYKNTAKATGKALKAEETGFLTGEFKAAKGLLVKLTINLSDDVSVLTNNSGVFSFNVPIKNVGDEADVDVSATAIDVEDFKHYKDASGKTQILEGTYTGTSVVETGAAWNDLGTVYYEFSPATGFAMWNNYAQYIAGWAYKKGYNVKKAVTGSAMLAVEDGFRVGHYEAAKNLPVKITAGGITYVAPTDNEGNWSIDVLQQFADDEYSVTWNTASFDIEDLGLTFTHYRNPGSEATMDLEGEYDYNGDVNPSSTWYEKGTRYYIFDPDGSPKNWETDLYGWAVWGADEKTTLTIEGNIKKAAEVFKAGTAQETWVNAANALADVTVGSNTFKVVTNGSGKFTVQIKVKEQPDNVTVTVSPDNIKETAFQHWTDQSDNGSKKAVPGTFKSADNISSTVVSKSGSTTRYPLEHSAKMTFKPDDGSLTGWGSYDWSGKYDDEE